MPNATDEARVTTVASDTLILCEPDGTPCGQASKTDCHIGQGRRHLAFSVFLYDETGRVILQQRSQHKWLWPLVWSNTVCSHPRLGESMDAAAHRRLHEELGLTASGLSGSSSGSSPEGLSAGLPGRSPEGIPIGLPGELPTNLPIGLPINLIERFTFEYHAQYEPDGKLVGSEHEVCTVYTGTCRLAAIKANPAEIAALEAILPHELDSRLAQTPERFSPWLQLEWPRLQALAARG